MKFATILALAATALAMPTTSDTTTTTNDLEARGGRRHGDCESCDDYGHGHRGGYHHGGRGRYHRGGYGRFHGQRRHCDNWVPCDKDLKILEIDAEICANVDVLGLINVNLDLDLEVDVGLLRQRYPSYSRLFCCPDNSCRRGQRLPVSRCWEHEFGRRHRN